MADIRSTILEKYGIDIAQDQILKWYKIDKKPGISDAELEAAIRETRDRWDKSIHGSNEKNAARDQKRMEHADVYESILRDPKLRKALYAYEAGGGSGAKNAKQSVEFAKEYFALVATTKRLNRKDVDFFFKYYAEHRKYKKDIEAMLQTEYHLVVRGGKGGDEEPDSGEEKTKETKKSEALIVNRFGESTVIKVRDCLMDYQKALGNPAVCEKYPELQDGMDRFLMLDKTNTIEQFAEKVKQQKDKAYALKQDAEGDTFIPMVDFFNKLSELSDSKDVKDNFPEFKLMLEYPNLTPYMYEFEEVKQGTLKGLLDVAKRDYMFRDESDFVINYYKPMYDNFGISNSGISAILRKADKKAKQNKVLHAIDKKLGRDKKRKFPFGAEVIHWLAYFPVFAAYFVFEVFRVIFTQMHRLTIPISIGGFVGANWLFPKIFHAKNLLVLGELFHKAEWYAIMQKFFGSDVLRTNSLMVASSLVYIVLLLTLYVLPTIFTGYFVSEFCVDMNKRFDWIGVKRTFANMLRKLKTESEKQYAVQKKIFLKQKIQKTVINLACLAVLVAGGIVLAML